MDSDQGLCALVAQLHPQLNDMRPCGSDLQDVLLDFRQQSFCIDTRHVLESLDHDKYKVRECIRKLRIIQPGPARFIW